ncbi:MAG: hypothetical protein HDR84_08425 [Bacteroides sp.]|nr:hypothetical protein [Bacteroides sp.]
MKRYSTFAITMLYALCSYAQSESEEQRQEETTNSTELQEIIVKGKNAWYEDGKAVFIPQRQAKNLSRNMQDLIERMNTGILTVENGQIQTQNGQPVSIYINGLPADNLDASTFWPKNALRVEYMESSDDPNYQGKSNILNFVMKDYVAGGLTKIAVDQKFPNTGDYQASSKLVWGRMTYQALFRGGYSRDHRTGTEQTENFENVWYDGIQYNNINRYENVDSYSRSNELYGSFTARYRKNNFVALHGVALQWNQNPGSGMHGQSIYTPRIIEGDMMQSGNDGHSLSPKVWGNYLLMNLKKGSFAASWSFNHSHNRGYSVYEDGNAPKILTATSENSYKYNANVAGSYAVRDNFYLVPDFTETLEVYNTAYSGSTLSHQNQINSNSLFKLQFWYKPISKLTLSITPQYTLAYRDVNHLYKITEHNPGLNANIYYAINNISYLSLSSWYAEITSPISERNDLILRQTELKWTEGNPEGKTANFYDLSLNYNIMPLSWISTSLGLTYKTNDNESIILYRSGGPEYDGVIGKYGNANNINTYIALWDFSFNLFDGHLRLYNQLQYSYKQVKGDFNSKVIYWRCRPSISCDFGNCSLYANYSSPEQYFIDGGTRRTKTYHQYELCFTYGNGNFIFDLTLENIFTKRLYSKEWLTNGPYSYTGRNWIGGKSIGVSMTYTFDYGKKVDPRIDISVQDLHSTSVLGSEASK